MSGENSVEEKRDGEKRGYGQAEERVYLSCKEERVPQRRIDMTKNVCFHTL
jgi:hypothetical protein